jgi:NADH:ubiquinone oxidoreductase subunit K
MTVSVTDAALIAILCLLAVGFYGLMAMRNLIKVIVALQILGKAALFALLMAGKAAGQVNLGQSLAVTVIVADTIVAVVGLALAIQVKRRVGTLDVKAISTLRG